MKLTAKLTGKRCGCPTCGEVFSTESNFERHRVGNYQDGRTCVDPSSVGLNRVETSTGPVWKMPPREEYAEKVKQ